ncbi:hypothetical protein D1871_23090 [Nakamurella silvestris]|nr:hypothetical protein D1871_23090 [Nakamurella silvestris]
MPRTDTRGSVTGKLVQEQRRLTEPEIDELVSSYLCTNNVRAVARQLGLDRRTVSDILGRRSVVISPFALSEQQLGRAIHLYQVEHLTLAAVARQVGSKPNTVRDALLRRGVTMRKRWDYQSA